MNYYEDLKARVIDAALMYNELEMGALEDAKDNRHDPARAYFEGQAEAYGLINRSLKRRFPDVL